MNSWADTAKIIGSLLLIFWTIEIADTYAFSNWFQTNGIQPRRTSGLDGILWHPFLHSGFSHIISNTIPFAVLGGFVALRGFKYWAEVTIISALLGGALTWLLGSSGNHIGVSGVIFAYFGALLGAAFFERQLSSMAIGLVVIFLYSTMLIGLIPQPFISWEGHLFGFLSGVGVAYFNREPRPKREPVVYEPNPEQWLS